MRSAIIADIVKDFTWAAPGGLLIVKVGRWINYLPESEEVTKTVILSLISFSCLLLWKRVHIILKTRFRNGKGNNTGNY